MAGSTATISIDQFRQAWCDHVPISQLCVQFTVTKDQVIRLRDVWQLPLRHDRRLRAKPKRQRDPTTSEIQAACLKIQSTWDSTTRESRVVLKPKTVSLRRISLHELGESATEEEEWN